MRVISISKRGSFILFAFTFVFLCVSVQSIQARQSERPFSLDLNFGGGLIGNSGTGTAFQPELGLGFMPGKWGVGINAGLYHFDSGFNTDQYRAGFEEYTVTEQNEDRWKSYFINAGPRFEQRLNRVLSMKLGLDLSMNYQRGPTQSVRFNDPTGEMENAGFDTNIILADMNGSANAGWSAALRPQIQLEFNPGFSERFSFNIRTGIQHRLSDREITYSTRDLSAVRPMDNVYEMHFQFENAPVVQRTETAPKTNFFANAGIKIRFGKSSRGLHPEGVIHRDVAARNPAVSPTTACPSSAPFRCPSGECVTSVEQCPSGGSTAQEPAESGDCNDEGECPKPGDALETGQDDNSSRSNRPRTEIPDNDRGGNSEFVHEARVMARLINPFGTIISAGRVTMSAGPDNPLHEESGEVENPIYEGQVNDDGNSDNGSGNDNVYTSPVQQYEIRPASYCVSLSTMQISTNSSKAMRSGAQNHNSSRSNRTSAVANPDLNTGGTSGQESTIAIPSAIQGIAVVDPTNLKPDTDQDGFPEIMKSASFSISKRSARTGRSQNPIYGSDTNTGSSAIYQTEDAIAADGGDLDGDGYGDVAADGFHFELEIIAPGLHSASSDTHSVERGSNPNAPPGSQVAPSQTKVIVMGITNNGDTTPSEESIGTAAELDVDSDEDGIPDFQDPDSDGDGLLDGLENATFSISEAADNDILSVIAARGGDRGAGTRSGGDGNPLAVDEMEWVESAVQEVRPSGNVYQWTYNLSSLANNGSEEIPAIGTLTVLFTGGEWHFDVQIDPDDDGDGFGDLLQNSSFSIREKGVLSNEY